MQLSVEEFRRSCKLKTYYKLLEEGFEDYVTTTGKGFELLGSKTENYFTKQAMKPINDLRDELEHQQKMIDQFESLGVKTARGSKNFQTDFEQGGTVGHLATKYGAKLENGSYVFTDKELIKMLKESPEDFETAKKELLLLSDEEIEAITIAAENGADSLSDFTTKIHAYSTALKSSEPEIYISSLVNLAEAYQQAEDKVKELKDKIDDLPHKYCQHSARFHRSSPTRFHESERGAVQRYRCTSHALPPGA